MNLPNIYRIHVHPSKVKKEVKQFFDNRFKECRWERPVLDGVPLEILGVVESILIIARFEEIKSVIWDCEGSKSLGPDGYIFQFIKSFWEILKLDVVRMVDEFHVNGRLPKGGISSFIALIPKKEDL
ncbi:hypothetical protein CR513_22105, partial [Mucuna pruriens]